MEHHTCQTRRQIFLCWQYVNNIDFFKTSLTEFLVQILR